MTIKGATHAFLSRAIILGLRLNHASKLRCRFLEKIQPVYKARYGADVFVLYCPNELTRWRAETFFTKEPDTIAWIESFGRDEVLFDIGANIGLYSLFAARRGAKVVAFEPAAHNFGVINRNFFLNGVGDSATCLNVALADHDGIESLYMPDIDPGAALNTVGEAMGWDETPFKPVYSQAVICYSLDSFIAQNPVAFPTRVKIDVDGIEPRIVAGAKRTFSDPRLQSVLIEITESRADHREITKQMKDCGLLPHSVGEPTIAPTGRTVNHIFSRR